jgi:hypothetical protein
MVGAAPRRGPQLDRGVRPTMTAGAQHGQLVGPLMTQVDIRRVVDVQRPAAAALLAAAPSATDSVRPAPAPAR